MRDGEKVLQCLVDKSLITKIYEELSQSIKKNPIENWRKSTSRHFTRKIQMTNNHKMF